MTYLNSRTTVVIRTGLRQKADAKRQKRYAVFSRRRVQVLDFKRGGNAADLNMSTVMASSLVPAHRYARVSVPMHTRIIQMSLPRFPQCVCKCYIVDIRQAFIWSAARYCYTKPPTSEFLLLTGSPQIINGEFEHAHVFQRDSSSNSISIFRIVFVRGRFLNRYLNCLSEKIDLRRSRRIFVYSR